MASSCAPLPYRCQGLFLCTVWIVQVSNAIAVGPRQAPEDPSHSYVSCSWVVCSVRAPLVSPVPLLETLKLELSAENFLGFLSTLENPADLPSLKRVDIRITRPVSGHVFKPGAFQTFAPLSYLDILVCYAAAGMYREDTTRSTALPWSRPWRPDRHPEGPACCASRRSRSTSVEQ